MQKKIVYIILLFFVFSCSRKPEAKGSFNDLIVISSQEDKDYEYPYLNKIISKKVNTPTEENEFNVKWVDSKDFFKFKDYKNRNLFDSRPMKRKIKIIWGLMTIKERDNFINLRINEKDFIVH